MVIFYSYVKLPEGTIFCWLQHLMSKFSFPTWSLSIERKSITLDFGAAKNLLTRWRETWIVPLIAVISWPSKVRRVPLEIFRNCMALWRTANACCAIWVPSLVGCTSVHQRHLANLERKDWWNEHTNNIYTYMIIYYILYKIIYIYSLFMSVWGMWKSGSDTF